MRERILGLLLLLAMPVCSWAALTTITFTELPFQPVNGVSLEGVTFADTSGADFNASDGGQEKFVQDPCLEGQTAGETLTLTFATPTPYLSFGVALSTQGSVTNAFTVNLVTSSGPKVFDVNTKQYTRHNPPDNFTTGQFAYYDPTATVTQATITFNTAAASAFGFDNLTFGTPDPLIATPTLDPKALAVLALMIGFSGLFLRRRTRSGL